MEKILIVDDDLDIIYMLAEYLRVEGYQVEEADSGMLALDRVRRNAPDLVLLDLNLPDYSGIVILERILRASPLTQIVIMTGEGDIATAVQAMKLGASDFLCKPFDCDKLKSIIESILKKEPDDPAYMLARPIIGESQKIKEVWANVARYARPDVSILLNGPSGTGKELFARAIHMQSKRRENVFVALDCATLPETLVESELFGHEKGAFTGAIEQKIGKFEQACGGTIFLDEIGNLPLNFQAKLLRVLQERYIDRLGGHKPIHVDVRVISATNLNLEQAVQKGTFREDLYYRLAEMIIHIPPLRERYGDIRLLVNHYIHEFNQRFARDVSGVSEDAWDILNEYPWPGNVRELENVVRSSLLAAESIIRVEHLPGYLLHKEAKASAIKSSSSPISYSLQQQIETALKGGVLDLKAAVTQSSEEIEKAILGEILERRYFTQHELCNLLNLDPKTLRAKLRKYGLKTAIERPLGTQASGE